MFQHKSFAMETKVNKDKGEFEAYAAAWNLDLVNDIIEPGAFSKTIQEKMPKSEIKVLFNHDHDKPLGLPLNMYEDSKGLFVHAKISQTSYGKDVLQLMEDGVLNKMSIGYDVVKHRFSEDGRVRYLSEIQLYEVSPVTFPANPEANILTVKKSLKTILAECQTEELKMLLKEGRVLSSKNIASLKAARDAIDEILQLAENGAGKATPYEQELQQLYNVMEQMKTYKI